MQPLEYPDSRTHSTTHKRRHLTSLSGQLLYNLLALTSVCVGLWMSLTSGDWHWFSRSGSLLVVLGVLLTSHQIIENSRRLKHRRTLHASNFKHDFAGDYDQHKLDQSSWNEEDAWQSGLRGLYLLVVGTLIWGFGDLPSLWLH